MGRFVDLTDKPFGRLTVKCYAGRNKHGQSMWDCVCQCGGTNTVMVGHLNSGATVSCGCLKKEIAAAQGVLNSTHRMSHTPEHDCWNEMGRFL